MATRRDQFQSYQFMVQRVVSALVLRETDPVQSPLRRMSGAAFGSVMLAVLAVGVVGVIGVISPGGNERWKDGSAIIVDDTGAPFVWMQDASGEFFLYPTANFASAALLVHSTKTIRVSRTSLVGAPRGPRLGIPNGPGSLPEPARMLGAPWTLCSLPAKTISGDEIPNTTLVIGRRTTTGVPIRTSAILVRDTERNSLHMVWNGHQYPIPDEAPVLEGLTLGSDSRIRVGTAWLSALPAGKDLAPLHPSGLGATSAALPGARVGQIRVVESGRDKQYYLVGSTKIAAITEVQAEIQLADPQTRELAYGGQPVTAQLLPAGDPADRIDLPAAQSTDPPANKPQMADVNSERSTVCASFANAGALPDVAVEAAVEGAKMAPATQRRTEQGTVLADHVQVEPGWGAIVESMVSSTADSGSLYLITDEGKRFAIPTAAVRDALGYRQVVPVQMPASLVARIPSGDALDPDRAKLAY